MQPTIFEITFFGISIAPKWYGFMYALGFLISYQFVKKYGKLPLRELDTLLMYVFFGVIGGGRLGYIFLYNLEYFLDNPSKIFHVWEGGMSFHGGLAGVILAVAIFSKVYNMKFFSLTDTLAIIVPVAIGLGRFGNYINGELPGYTPYQGPFAMNVNGFDSFPSPLFEMLLEGGLLFLIMLFFGLKIGFFAKNNHQKKSPHGFLSAVFLIGYSIMRLISEQFRLPDAHIGYLLGTEWLSLGMIYTLPLLFIGISILFWSKKNAVR